MRIFFNKMLVRKLSLLVLFTFVFIIIYISLIKNSPIDDVDRKIRLQKIDELIHNHASFLACKQPKLPTFSAEMMKFVHEVPPLDCSDAGTDWVKCIGSDCRVQEHIKIMHGPVECSFTDIIRLNDFSSTTGKTTISDSFYKLEVSDVVEVICTAQEKIWHSTITGIRLDTEIWSKTSWDKLSPNAAKLNVLMFGFDSISRNSFIRKLPKSYEYLKNVLKGDILEGYNIVGDGTPQALIPILTGHTELELPDTRKRFKNTQFVNSYPFIWNDYRSAGYVTGFFEDVPQLSTFTYRLNGFNETPTDHYMRPYYLAALDHDSLWPQYCAGGVPRHQIMLNQITSFFSVYKKKPKFLFGFHGELSHDDYNLVQVADNDLYEFLKNLKNSGSLDNTLLILMADHGHRFAEIRNTIQGKQEERLPFFSFTFPESFKVNFRQAYENFQNNIERLTTPFDIHQTLKSLLELDDVGDADITKRSVSLFTKIPPERSCANAYIEPHWCACLDWEQVPLSERIAGGLAEALVFTINEYTKSHRNLCEPLKVSEIKWVSKMKPNENLVKYKQSVDFDGFVGDFSAKMAITTEMYQIKVILVPGNSIFEASITYFRKEEKFDVKMSDISRINMYGKQASCIEKEFPHLRKYCYCKN